MFRQAKSVICIQCQQLRLWKVADKWRWVWGIGGTEKPKYSNRNLSQCHFVHHKSHTHTALGSNPSLCSVWSEASLLFLCYTCSILVGTYQANDFVSEHHIYEYKCLLVKTHTHTFHYCKSPTLTVTNNVHQICSLVNGTHGRRSIPVWETKSRPLGEEIPCNCRILMFFT